MRISKTSFVFAAIAAAFGGLCYQWWEIGSINEKIRESESRIASFGLAGSLGDETPSGTEETVSEFFLVDSTGTTKFKWDDIVQLLVIHGQSGASESPELIRLPEAINELTVPELLAALDEVDSSEIEGRHKALLDQLLIGPLGEKDPEVALERMFGARPRFGIARTLSPELPKIFAGWVSFDPKGAIGWVDQKISAGEFNNKGLWQVSDGRIKFETEIYRVLSKTDFRLLTRKHLAIARQSVNR